MWKYAVGDYQLLKHDKIPEREIKFIFLRTFSGYSLLLLLDELWTGNITETVKC